MKYTCQPALILLLLSCSQSEENSLDNWKLDRIETIKHFEQGNQKIQIIYSTLNVGLTNLTDTSLIVQRYQDTLLLEEIRYNLQEGDTSKWSHHINHYNTLNQLITKIDSVDGQLRTRFINSYKENNLVRTEQLTLIPEYTNMMELVGTDTIQDDIFRFYDETGRCIKVINVGINKLSTQLTGATKIDSTVTVNQFDDQYRNIGSITLMNGDTIGMSRTVYDEFGRIILIAIASPELETFSHQYEYDEMGNTISELRVSDDFTELVRTEFDAMNRPIKRETYQQKTNLKGQ